MACNVIRQSRKNMTEIRFKELGLVEYSETYEAMMLLIESQPSFHSIWSLEHFPVFTIGISEKEITEDKLQTPPFIKTDRGGKTTFHAPGQQVFYFKHEEIAFSSNKPYKKDSRDYIFGFGFI